MVSFITPCSQVQHLPRVEVGWVGGIPTAGGLRLGSLRSTGHPVSWSHPPRPGQGPFLLTEPRPVGLMSSSVLCAAARHPSARGAAWSSVVWVPLLHLPCQLLEPIELFLMLCAIRDLGRPWDETFRPVPRRALLWAASRSRLPLGSTAFSSLPRVRIPLNALHPTVCLSLCFHRHDQ